MSNNNNRFNSSNLNEILPLGENYFISKDGLFKKDMRAKNYMISMTFGKLLTIERKWINKDGELSYDLAYEFEGTVKKITVPHQLLLSKELSKLSIKGVPIDQNFVKDITNALFIVGSEIKATSLIRQLGFYENKDELFFSGVNSPEVFETAINQYFEIQTKGTEQGELKFVTDLICPYPGLFLTYCLGLSSIMIYLLNYKSDCDLYFPFYYLTGDSSKGKTTATMAAVSAFGNPNPKNAKSFVQAFSSTENSLIKTMTNFNGYTIGIDDMGGTSNSRNAFIYSAVNGREKSRSLSDGTVVQGAGFNVVAIGNGEVSLSATLSDHAGAQLRAIEFSIPLTENQEHSEQIKKAVKRSYGHISKTFADELLKLDFTEVFNQYTKNLKFLLKSIEEPSSKTLRYSKQLGAILTTADYFCSIFEINVDCTELITLLKRNQLDSMEKLEYSKLSYLKLKEYIYQNKNKFDGMSLTDNFGFITIHEKCVEVAIISTAMKKIAMELELPDLRVFMGSLREKGLLSADKNRLTKKVKGVRCYVVKFDEFYLEEN